MNQQTKNDLAAIGIILLGIVVCVLAMRFIVVPVLNLGGR